MNKQELRKIYRQKRSLLSKEEILNKSSHISSIFFSSFDLSAVSSIHLFLPIADKNEINTWEIIHTLWEKYPTIKVLVPKMAGEELHTFLLNKNTSLKENSWGIPEPIDSVEFDNGKIELMLIPLLAFDKKGHRVGYGKGFYDKLLSKCNPHVIKVGVSFFEVEELIDAESFDVPLNFCVSPSQLYSF